MSPRRRPPAPGLSLVEVLIAVAVLGIVTAALVALQVGSLRTTRQAMEVREVAAAAEHQLALARVLPELPGCRGLESWPSVAACQVTSACHDAACDLRTVTVRIESQSGRVSEFATASFLPLEGAMTGGGE